MLSTTIKKTVSDYCNLFANACIAYFNGHLTIAYQLFSCLTVCCEPVLKERQEKQVSLISRCISIRILRLKRRN
jgi:hypothetical protein